MTATLPLSITVMLKDAIDECYALQSITLGKRRTTVDEEDNDDDYGSLVVKAFERHGSFHMGILLENILE